MQSEIYKKQHKKGHIWLEQNLTLRITSAIVSMIEQMVKPRAQKEARELTENSQCRLCGEQRETKKQNLLGQNVKWYQEKWKRGHVLENSQAKLV